jgi:hypothetical protein
MKTIANKIAAFAVTAVALGTAAFGQTTQKADMRTEIPFTFHTARGTMPAGQYDVIENYAGVSGVFALRNTASNKVALVSGSPSGVRNSEGSGITFRCDDGCELAAIRTSRTAVTFPEHKSTKAWKAAMVAVHVTSANGQ